MSTNQDINLKLRNAIELIQKKEYKKAEKVLISILNKNNNTEVLRLLGVNAALNSKNVDALNYFNQALVHDPNNPIILSNIGNIYLSNNQLDDAIIQYKKSIEVFPNYSEVWSNLASAYQKKGDFEEAHNKYQKALEINSSDPLIWSNFGNLCQKMGNLKKAIEYQSHSLVLNPNSAVAWTNLGYSYLIANDNERSLEAYKKAIAIDGEYTHALESIGNLFNRLKDHKNALMNYEKAYQINNEIPFLLGKIIHQKLLLSDWSKLSEYIKILNDKIDLYKQVAEPFGYLAIGKSANRTKLVANIYAENYFPSNNKTKYKYSKSNKKIRIGYVCGEFRNHATSILMSGIYRNHNKNSFEIYAFDNGLEDSSEIRSSIIKNVDYFIDIKDFKDIEVCNLINNHSIDILVNLNGYFGSQRQAVFSSKPAPIQINYLGFPGTLGTSYMDYIIADNILIKAEDINFYNEKIIFMPNSYQPNDDLRLIYKKKYSKEDFGFDDKSIILCCFNNNYKIQPDIFCAWIEILSKTQNTVLWLLEPQSSIATVNLQKEFRKSGLDESRLVFASWLSPSDHLARIKIADLFLDTFPCNAHTTASDALWAGIPVVTLSGQTFASRVAASLLNAVEMPELVAQSYDDYIKIAIELCHDHNQRSVLKSKLTHNHKFPLFHTTKYTKDLEKAYKEIYDLFIKNQSPKNIYIT